MGIGEGSNSSVYQPMNGEGNMAHTGGCYFIINILSILTCYIMDELWEYQAKWKKPDMEEHIFYDLIYIKYLD